VDKVNQKQSIRSGDVPLVQSTPTGEKLASQPQAKGARTGGRTSRWNRWVIVGMSFAILVPSMYGFVGKFVELVRVFQTDPSGAFAVAPIANYLLASAGFFCLLLWAATNGMFKDIENPKALLLDREAYLDHHSERRFSMPSPTGESNREMRS
jgi:hypothetical protein